MLKYVCTDTFLQYRRVTTRGFLRLGVTLKKRKQTVFFGSYARFQRTTVSTGQRERLFWKWTLVLSKVPHLGKHHGEGTAQKGPNGTHRHFFQVRENRCRNELTWKTLWPLPTTTQLIPASGRRGHVLENPGPRAATNPSALLVGVG